MRKTINQENSVQKPKALNKVLILTELTLLIYLKTLQKSVKLDVLRHTKGVSLLLPKTKKTLNLLQRAGLCL